MYGPPRSDSEDDDYDGYMFGDDEDFRIITQRVKENHVTDPCRDIENTITAGDLVETLDLMRIHNINVNDVLTNGYCALSIACRLGKLDFVKYFLDHGADPNLDVDSMTVLMDACSCTEPDAPVKEIVEALIEKGAVINTCDKYGMTPLMWACKNGHLDVIRIMIADASYDACDNQGCTALFYAIENNRADIVKFLIESGVDGTLPNRKGYTPRQVAQFHGFNDILEVLPDEKRVGYEVPTRFLAYNDICDIIPRIFLKSECPEYFQDINLILYRMGMDYLLEYFAKERVSLSQFLTMTDSKLEAVGIKYPIHRSKLLKGLLRFHLQQWTKKSIARVRRGPPENFYEILVISANHVQNMVIINSSLKFLHANLLARYCGEINSESVQIFRERLKDYKKTIKDLKSTSKYLESFRPNRPPLYIDYDDYLAEKRRAKIKKFVKYSIFIALSVAVCLKVKKVFHKSI